MTVDLIPTRDALGYALSLIELSTDRRSGRVGDREIVAGDPRELQSKMAAACYEVLHAGLSRSPVTNHPRRLRDPGFEAVLSARVAHRTSRVGGTVCVPVIPALPVPPDAVLVELNGIRVWVPIALLDGVSAPLPGASVTVIHAAARPALSPGFLVADGSCGVDRSELLLRLYVHLLDASSAPDVWETALASLEAAGARYQAKILSAPGSYPRRDALVVYLSKPDWHHVPALVEQLAGLAGLGEDTSLFTQQLAPGVALAFEPADPDSARRSLSFGQHRSSVLMHALFATADTGTDAREAVAVAFAAARIDTDRPFRNTDSPPLPFADLTENH